MASAGDKVAVLLDIGALLSEADLKLGADGNGDSNAEAPLATSEAI
jgi:hypothetical protein